MPIALKSPGLIGPDAGLPRAGSLVMEQFRLCGYVYALRKFLHVSLRLVLVDHLAVARALSLPHTGELTRRHPPTVFKYLRTYLARSFDIHARATVLSAHYRYLDHRVRPDFIGRIWRGGIPLWEAQVGEDSYAIGLGYPKNEEGELLLNFSANGATIFTLCFAIAPGAALGVPDTHLVFIGRLQGANHARDAIRRASQALHDVSPAALLLDAAGAIAAALGLGALFGVSAANQVCLRDGRSAIRVYDEFWLSCGGSPVGSLGYYLRTDQEKKPLSSIKNKYRSRVKRKRQFRSELADQVGAAFAAQCLRPQAG